MKQELVTITKEEYEELKRQANIDIDMLKQLTASLIDIKQGRVRRVK